MKTFKQESDILTALTPDERVQMAVDAKLLPVGEYFDKHPVQLAVLIKVVEIAIFLLFAKPVLQLSLKALLEVLKAQQGRLL
jgi:hypothetical protein